MSFFSNWPPTELRFYKHLVYRMKDQGQKAKNKIKRNKPKTQTHPRIIQVSRVHRADRRAAAPSVRTQVKRLGTNNIPSVYNNFLMSLNSINVICKDFHVRMFIRFCLFRPKSRPDQYNVSQVEHTLMDFSSYERTGFVSIQRDAKRESREMDERGRGFLEMSVTFESSA